MGKDNGGPAFPTREKATIREGDKWILRYEGMTLRDWFAGQALAGILAGNVWKEYSIPDNPAAEAYRLADTMLAERNRKE